MASSIDVRAVLGKHLTQTGDTPMLFVGSGVARRYLDLPDWRGLLARFSAYVGEDVQYFLGQANSHLPTAATYLSERFYDVWWKHEDFALSRERWSDRVSRRDHPLKFAIADYLREQSEQADLLDGPYADELKLLRNLDVDGVVTTNWDTMLEQLFPELEPFVGQERLLFGGAQGIGEIYKIHGCCTEPETMVLTADDYMQFDRRNPYLSARLVSMFVEHPIVFLGYSLSDDNIQKILSSIVACLTGEHLQRLQDRLIFVERCDPGRESIERRDQHFGSLRLPVQVVRVNDFGEIFQALGTVQRKLPARILRTLRQRVYELVQTTEPVGEVHVQDIDDSTNIDEIDVVLGVGMKRQIESAPKVAELGYTSYNRDHLVRGLLRDDLKIEPGSVVEKVLPAMAKRYCAFPSLRYLAGAKYRFANGAWTPALDERLATYLGSLETALQPSSTSFQPYRRKALALAEEGKTFADLLDGDMARLCYVGSFLPWGCYSEDVLLQFLQDNVDAMLRPDSPYNNVVQTQFLRLACIYDAMKYGPTVGVGPWAKMAEAA